MWDVFISHASEDKAELAAPLALALKKRGLTVWYDDFSLALGDSLRRSIDKGLANSKYGVVILSPDFLSKEWPQRELDALITREINGTKVILPVWHNVNADYLGKYSPLMADRFAISSELGVDKVAEKIVAVVNGKGSYDGEIDTLSVKSLRQEFFKSALSHHDLIKDISFGHNSKFVITRAHSIQEWATDRRSYVLGLDDIRVWDVETGNTIKVLNHKGRGCFAVSPVDAQIAIQTFAHIVIVDLFSGEVIQKIKPKWFENGLNPSTLFFSRDGSSLFSSDTIRGIEKWDVNSGQRLNIICKFSNYNYEAIAISSDEEYLVAASKIDEDIKLIHVETGQIKYSLKTGYLSGACFSSDATILMTYSRYSGGVNLWNAKTGDFLNKIRSFHTDCATFIPNSNIIIVGRLGAIEFWDTSENKIVFQNVAEEGGGVDRIAISPDMKCLAYGSSGSGLVKLWNLNGLLHS